MSGLADILGSALGGDAISKIASQLGVDQSVAQAGVAAALPTLLGRLKENADAPEGATALAGAVERDHDGAVLDDMNGFLGGGFLNGPGAKILGKVFGADQPSAEEQVAKSSGLDLGSAAKLLAMLAPIILGALGKQGKNSGGLQAALLPSILGGLLGGGSNSGGGLGDLLGGILGGGAGAPAQAAAPAPKKDGGMMGKVTDMVDQNNDGSIVDDVVRMATKGSGAANKGGAGGLLGKLAGMLAKKK